MTESVVLKNSARWKRSLIGGLISGLLSGILISLFQSGVPIDMLVFGFGLPLFFFDPLSDIVNILVVTIFWFMVGATITYFVSKNLIAIVIWLTVYVISFIIAFLSFASAMMGG